MDIIMPKLGESSESGIIIKWYKKVGDQVEAKELLLEVEGEKATLEVTATEAGLLSEILVQEGDSAPSGAVLAKLSSESPQRLSPAVRALVKSHQLDINRISGSGKNGRITKKDVMEAIKPAQKSAMPLSSIRRSIGSKMTKALKEVPHVAQGIDVDFEAVYRIRKQLGDDWKSQHGFSLTYLPFIIRSLCLAIEEYPLVNAWIQNDELIVHDAVHMGIVVDLNYEGLVIPVLRHANTFSAPEIARNLHELIKRAKSQRLTSDELSGATYTVSNPGGYGTLFTTAVINQPQVAILSTDGIKRKPCLIEAEDAEAIGIRAGGILTQSFDHRAMDGAYSAAFLRHLSFILSNHDWKEEFNNTKRRVVCPDQI